MRSIGHAISAVGFAVVTLGCRQPAGRVLPDVTMRDGVEVATVPPLPRTLDPQHLWRFEALRRLSTVAVDSGDPVVYDPAAVLPLSDGMLLVHDPDAAQPLVIVDPNTGMAITRFGRRGHGPGELGPVVVLSEPSPGSIHVFDVRNRQLHEYSPAGGHVRSTPIRPGLQPLDGHRGPAEAGYIFQALLSGEDHQQRRALMTLDGPGESPRLFSVLPEPPGHGHRGIQAGRYLWAVAGQAVVTMWSAEPVFDVYDQRGNHIREVRLPLTVRELTDRDIAVQVKRYGGIASTLQPGPIGLTNVLYSAGDSVVGMYTSELWHAAEDPAFPEGARYWRLFTVRGEYLGMVRQPDDFRYLGRGHGVIWARVLDENASPVLEELRLVRD